MGNGTSEFGFSNIQSRKPWQMPPDRWMTCAILSLQHAMLLLGHPVAFADIQRMRPAWRRPLWEGIAGIVRLARSLGFRAQRIETGCFDELRHEIDGALAGGLPVIVGVEDNEHWAVLAGRDSRRYVSVDSADSPAFRLRSWAEIREWYGQADDDGRWLEAVVIGPRRGGGARGSLVPSIRRHVAALNRRGVLRGRWGQCLHVLRSAGLLPGKAGDGAGFLRRHSGKILRAVREAGCSGAAVADLATVAAAHRLGAPGGDATRATGRIAKKYSPAIPRG